jgi:tryptophan-rich sensory protein
MKVEVKKRCKIEIGVKKRMQQETKGKIAMLFSLIVICFFVELMGDWWTRYSVSTWYPTLKKPAWTPPGYLFGPVWSMLYLLMAIAMWLVWQTETALSKTSSYVLFGVGLFLNLLWSFFFFRLQNPSLALLNLIALDIIVIATIFSFYPINRLAALLFVPYLIWIVFATALNVAIVFLN